MNTKLTLLVAFAAVMLLFMVRKKTFRYLEPLWTGGDGKISIRSTLALGFSVNLIQNLTHAVYRWDVGKSLDGLALVLGIEAGLIAALLSLTTYQNITATKATASINSPASINVENVETVNATEPKINV